MNQYRNIRQAKAIEQKNKERLLKVNPAVDDENGIYILWRTETHGYIGQTRQGILTRLAQHMTGFQHIDLSMKTHGLYSEDNKNGYKIDFIHCPVSQLDDKEREYIQKAIDCGWILKNKTSGGQDDGKEKIADFRPSRGYHDGLKQGYKNAMKYIRNLLDKHLEICLKPEKQNNKVSIRQYEKFMEKLKRESNEDSDKETV